MNAIDSPGNDSLRDIAATLLRRKWQILAVFIVVVARLRKSLSMTPVRKASVIQVDYTSKDSRLPRLCCTNYPIRIPKPTFASTPRRELISS
jgi:hypothetical protein